MATVETDGWITSKLVEEDPSFADLVQEFVAGLDDRVEGMQRALKCSEFETLKMLAHQLKGAGGGHGYQILTELCEPLESCAAARQLEECNSLVAELKATISRVGV